MEDTTSKPKLSTSTLDIKSNFFVVPNAGLFNYFPVKIDADTADKPIMVFEKGPPILVDGIVIHNKKLYEVTSQDILRGIVRKSREIKVERDTRGSAKPTRPASTPVDTSSTDSAKNSIADVANKAIRDKQHSRVIETAELELAEAANAAWEDQVGTLLDFISSQEGEEWEIEGSA